MLSSLAHISGKALVICGPSGSGKSTLIAKVVQEFGERLSFCVSHTTRAARLGELNGREYHFVSKSVFELMIANKDFVEFVEFSGNYYGTSWRALTDVQRLGRIPILDVEIEGIRSLKKSNLNARYIFINPPDIATLEQNLRGRGTESEACIQKRLKRAIEDMKATENDNGLFDVIIVNKDLNAAHQQLRQFVDNFIKN